MKMAFFLRCFYLLLDARPSPVGGQAIIEGVMMRSKHAIAMAVRRKKGDITEKQEPFVSYTKRNKLLGLPIIRGFVQLVESLVLGISALNYSADVAMEDEKMEKAVKIDKTWKDTAATTLSLVISFVVAIAVFMYFPLSVSNWIKKDQNPFLFNLMAGAVRIALFLAYIRLISLWKDIRRIFEYHGAEHKSIFAYEDDLPLTVEFAKKYATHHPRCGTSFLLIVAVVCILLFALVDGIIISIFGPYPTVLHRFAVHFAFIPLVSGVSYEILKASEKGKNNAVVAVFIKPGLWLQRITTREPDDGQLEVAIAALKAAIKN